MALILAAPLLTVARVILSKGVRQASKKYGPKLIKKTKDYIKKNKIIWDGKKIVKQPKGSTIKTVRPTNKKTKTTKKDSFDEALKKKEGAKNFNKLNKTVKTKNPKLKVKNNKKVNAPKNKKVDDSKLVSNVNKPSVIAPNLKKAAKVGAGIVLTGLAIPPISKVLNNMSKSKGSEPSNFAAAFRKARKEKGTDSTFTYKGKQYSTVTMDEVKKAGFNTLREYLNAKKKK